MRIQVVVFFMLCSIQLSSQSVDDLTFIGLESKELVLNVDSNTIAEQVSDKDMFTFLYFNSGCAGPSITDTIHLVRENNTYKGIIKSWENYSSRNRKSKIREVRLSEEEFNKFTVLENQCKEFKRRSMCSVDIILFVFMKNNIVSQYQNVSCEPTIYGSLKQLILLRKTSSLNR